LYWDLVTGEIIIDHKRVLKRTEGIENLFGLTPLQVKILKAMHSRAGRDAETLAEDANVSLTDTKRTLTALKKKSMIRTVGKETPKDRSSEKYIRIKELNRVPDKIEKVKLELPKIRNYEMTEEVIKPQVKIKDIEKTVGIMAPRSKILGTETIHYPYFRVHIRGHAPGKGGIRIMVIDAISGKEDKELTDIVRFLK
jgi:predicted transcriptional regulator